MRDSSCKFAKIFILFCLFVQNTVLPGFAAGTLVKTPDGYVPIENLRVGDSVTGFTGESFVSSRVTNIYPSKQTDACVIDFVKDVIYASRDQLIYNA